MNYRTLSFLVLLILSGRLCGGYEILLSTSVAVAGFIRPVCAGAALQRTRLEGEGNSPVYQFLGSRFWALSVIQPIVTVAAVVE